MGFGNSEMRVVQYGGHLYAIQETDDNALIKTYDEYTKQDEVLAFATKAEARFWIVTNGFCIEPISVTAEIAEAKHSDIGHLGIGDYVMRKSDAVVFTVTGVGPNNAGGTSVTLSNGTCAYRVSLDDITKIYIIY